MKWHTAWTIDPAVVGGANPSNNQQAWTESIAGDDLAFVRDAAEMLARGWPWRQYVIFYHTPPGDWLASPRRYILGASDNDLYRNRYGHDAPIGSAGQAMFSGLDHELCR